MFGSLQWTFADIVRAQHPALADPRFVSKANSKEKKKKGKKKKRKKKKKSRIIEENVIPSIAIKILLISFYISKYETFSVFLDEGAIVREDVLSCSSSSSSKDGVRIITIIKKKKEEEGVEVFLVHFLLFSFTIAQHWFKRISKLGKS